MQACGAAASQIGGEGLGSVAGAHAFFGGGRVVAARGKRVARSALLMGPSPHGPKQRCPNRLVWGDVGVVAAYRAAVPIGGDRAGVHVVALWVGVC